MEAHTKTSVRIYWSPRKCQDWLNFRKGADRDIELYRNKRPCAPFRTFIFNLNLCGNKKNWILYLLYLQELHFHQGFSETLLAKLRASGRLFVRTMRQRVMRQRHWTIKRKNLSVGRKPNMNYARRSDTHFQKVHDHKFIISCDQFWMQYFQCNVNSMYFSRVIFTSVHILVKLGYLLLSSCRRYLV